MWRTCRPSRSLGLPLLAALAVATVAIGCEDKQKRARKVLEDTRKECREAEGRFATLELFGETEREVLRSTCENEISSFQMPDPFSAKAEIGPYTWTAGLYEPKDLWVVKNIEWNDLEMAREHLNTEEAEAETLGRAAELFASAQKRYPSSSWIRLRRLEARLRAQRRDMGSESASSFELNDSARRHYEETVEWADQNGDTDTRVRARLMVLDHYRSYIQFYRDAKNALGSKDDWLENSIDEAENNNRPERAEEYRTQLEKRREARPKKRERYDQRIAAIQDAICETIGDLDPVGIDDSSLENRALTANDAQNCSGGSANGEEQGEGATGNTDEEGNRP